MRDGRDRAGVPRGEREAEWHVWCSCHAAGTESLSAFGQEEDASLSPSGLGWPASALARDWECVGLTSSSSSEFGRGLQGTQMGDG